LPFPSADECYQAHSRRLRVGSIYRAPILFYPQVPLQHLALAADGSLEAMDFDEAYIRASPQDRDIGLVTLVRAKRRPVVLLTTVSSAELQTLSERQQRRTPRALVLPLYHEQSDLEGSHLIAFPAAPAYSLEAPGSGDILAICSLPLSYLRPRDHLCDLTRPAIREVLQRTAGRLTRPWAAT